MPKTELWGPEQLAPVRESVTVKHLDSHWLWSLIPKRQKTPQVSRQVFLRIRGLFPDLAVYIKFEIRYSSKHFVETRLELEGHCFDPLGHVLCLFHLVQGWLLLQYILIHSVSVLIKRHLFFVILKAYCNEPFTWVNKHWSMSPLKT